MTAAVAFGLGTLVMAATYLALLSQIRSSTVRALVITRQPVEVNGQTVLLPQLTAQELRTVESVLKEIILNQVALVGVFIVIGLFLISLLVGWFAAGRALKPLGRITQVAQEIEATDLSRRIGLDGPDDELTRVARTFDAMLDRLDGAFTAQRTMLAQTSHDLRTPLTIIRSNLDVALADPEATADDWRNTAVIVSRAAERMSTMVDDLLAVARLVAGNSQLVSVDLGEVVQEVDEEVRARALATNIAVHARTETAVVVGDRTALTRAFGNIVDNAVGATPSGGDIRLFNGQLDGWGYMAVADRGPGLDPKLVRGEGEVGAGMGLRIVREVASAHRGEVDVSRRPGGGSVVAIWIPVSDDPDARPAILDLPLL